MDGGLTGDPDLTSILNAASPFFDLKIAADALSLESAIIPSLINKTKYYVKAALVDQAGNVGFYTPVAMDKEEHSVTPDKVEGTQMLQEQ